MQEIEETRNIYVRNARGGMKKTRWGGGELGIGMVLFMREEREKRMKKKC